MHRYAKRAALALLGLAVVAGGVVAVGHVWAGHKMQRQIVVDARPVAWTADPQAVARGRYLYLSRGCADCHGVQGEGREFINDGGGMRVRAPNITQGPGSVVAGYQAVDWVRAIRHGVKPDGRPLLIMPSEDYNRLTDADLAALMAYVRQMPPRRGGAAQIELPVIVRAMYGLGAVRDAAEKIDHSLPPARPVPEGVTLEHGAYVANMCLGCHGAKLAGGPIPGAPPDWPPAANLRVAEGGGMAGYAKPEVFAGMLRSGRRPDGSIVKVMPFDSLRELSDVDVRALHLYLLSLR